MTAKRDNSPDVAESTGDEAVPSGDALETYRAKRDFDKTPEPGGGEHAGDALTFVVQEHHATRLHWDFRLELDGVLLSWAVPKGPSLDPHDKRLAVRTEDHPLDYGSFEGEIPKGEYGGGTVLIWDHGTWEPVGDPRAGLEKGDFKFELSGERLTGRFVLVRMKPRPKDHGENWLLIKERDDHGREDYTAEVLLDSREPGGEAVAVDGATGGGVPKGPPPTSALPGLALCTLVSTAPTGPGWLTEVKYDGYRLRVRLADGAARCLSRSDTDVTERFAAVARAAQALPATSALLDGEAVVFDEKGVSDFGALQEALSSAPERIAYAAFDLLELNGHDLTGLSTVARKDLLGTLIAEPKPTASRIVFAHHVVDDGAAFFETACAQGLEGAVFKRAGASYPRGRTRDWLKVKCRHEQEFVVVGWTPPKGSRAGFGALVLGVNDDSGRLRATGRVGSGFTERDLTAISSKLATLVSRDAPVDSAPRDAEVTWVEPVLVVSVAFAEWTADGVLRQPSFLRLRDDVDPASVRRETAAPAGPPEATGASGASGASGVSGASGASGASEDAPHDSPPARKPGGSSSVAGVTISNPDKALFPDSALTKLDLARYYEAVAPAMLVDVAGRPLTLVRCPVGDGSATCFHQRHPDRGLADAIEVLRHALPSHDEAEEWLTVHDAAGLVSLAQMGVAEIHTWLSREDAPGRPDRIVFDLDPGEDVSWDAIVAAAHAMRDECESLGFDPHLKSTGSKGLHIVNAIEPVWDFERVKALTRGIAERVCARNPDTMTPKMAKAVRVGRVFVDYLRNAEAASVVAPYSTRFLPGPSVAVPLAWSELDDPTFDQRAFTTERVIERLAAGTDPWAAIEESAVGSRVLRAAEGTLDV